VLSRMSAISTLRSPRSGCIEDGLHEVMRHRPRQFRPSSASAIALASSRPIQIGTTLPDSGSRRTDDRGFRHGSTVTPATVTSLGMGRPLFPDKGVGSRAGHGARNASVLRRAREVKFTVLLQAVRPQTHPPIPRARSFDKNGDRPSTCAERRSRV